MVMLDLGLGQATEYQLSLLTIHHDDLTEAPLNKRGWVTQERYLARKQLSFAKSQVYWECRELIASEQFPMGIPEKVRDFFPHNQTSPPDGKPTLDLTTEADLRRAWCALVDFYSECAFTRSSDRMIALAGLIEEMRKATGDIYLAGLWKKDLQSQLCWAPDFDVRRTVNRSTTPTYLAPTWSWANMNGPVISDMRYHIRDSEYTSCIEVLDASVHSEHSSELHSFVSSNLVLRGIGVWARAIQTDKSANQATDECWDLQFTDPVEISHPYMMAGTRASIMWDENMSCSKLNPKRWPSFVEERRSNLLFMFVGIKDSAVHGLILRKLPGVTNEVVYVRMGIFDDYCDFVHLLFTRLKYPPGYSTADEINLDDAGLADLIHTVTIV